MANPSNANPSNAPGRDLKGPALEVQDWTDLDGATEPVSSPDNGDLRYAPQESPSGDLPGEDDDNPFQESDEALPNAREEAALRRDPSKEKDRFGEI